MKNIYKIIYTFTLMLLASPGFAYCIYNQSNYPLHMKDTHLGGMERDIQAYHSACCAPDSFGCKGNMHIKIYSYYDPDEFQCDWQGKIDGTGHYFVVTKIVETVTSPCTIKHYRD